jgi:hypothetical protein|tara:strand:- start:610 stop:1221 length:612 start_codon:yes stop_codon:yes gene_type:complete
MARKTFNFPIASSGIVLSTAYKDWGNSTWRPASTGSFQDVHGSNRWVTLKIMKDNPYFDVDWNLGIDHASTWNSECYRLVMSYSTDNKSSWSNVKNCANYTTHQCWTQNANTVGNSRGANTLYNPTALNLTAGNYIAFGIQCYPDSSSGRCYINQNSENHSGDNSSGTPEYKGGGSFLRVRELDFSNSSVVLEGSVCSGTTDV